MPQGSWNSSAGQGRWPPGEQEELHRCSRAQFWMPAEEKLVCVGRESNPGQLLGRQLCSPLYHQRCSARAAARRRPRARPSTLSPQPPPHPCPDAPSAGGSAPPPAPPAAHQQPHPRQLYAAAGVHRPHRPGAALPRPCGPPAVRSPPRPANASALTPGGQRGARGFQQPAGQSPSPPCAGRGHFPRRQGDTGASRLQASRRSAAPRGRREPRSPLRQPLWAGGPQDPAMVGQGRGVAKEAVAPPWRPSARRRQRAQAGGLHR